jgi:hypothetical protein
MPLLIGFLTTARELAAAIKEHKADIIRIR